VVKKISIDCDGDALLLQVEQQGNACHTGEHSCFYRPVFGSDSRTPGFGEVINSLSRLIRQRQIDQPPDSYTTYLFQSGIDKILKKVGEESGEIIIAAKNHNAKEIAWEVSDLLYHLLVMLAAERVDLADISAELAQRATKQGKKTEK
jgi:phosphoribosyl-ATP pyrophosphohydrolase/phosphoribosyl-AMP cyclohydrolase